MSKTAYGYLWTLNGILILPRAAHECHQALGGPYGEQSDDGKRFVLSGAYVVIVTVHSYPGMILAMVLATLGKC